MTFEQLNVRRQFNVRKDDGSEWLMQYTEKGVQWVRATARDTASAPLMPNPPSAVSANRAPVPASVAAVLDAGAQLGQVWEMRQQRLLQQAFYEDRRLQWLDEMIGRWGRVHEALDGLDFGVSEYLAREARQTMHALVANRKWALPQSTLHDLSLITDVFRTTREQLLKQFEAFEADKGLGLTALIETALPGRTLNMALVRQLAADPRTEWERLVLEKATAEFDVELQQILRSSEAFFDRLFSSTAVATVSVQPQPGIAELAHRFFSDLIARLPNPEEADWKGDAWQRRDAFRELLLLPAEVDRVRTLTSAWLAVTAIVEQAIPSELTVAVGGPQVRLALEGSPACVNDAASDTGPDPAMTSATIQASSR